MDATGRVFVLHKLRTVTIDGARGRRAVLRLLPLLLESGAFNTGADFRYANNTLRPDDCRAHARAMFARTWVICTIYGVFQVAGFLVREGL